MRVTSVHTYPVKGCHRVDHRRATVQPWGLVGDRRWLISDDEGEMLTQREAPLMTQVFPSIVDGQLVLRAEGRPDLAVAARPAEAATLTVVKVWGTPVALCPAGEDADAWLSAMLDRKVHLRYLDDPTCRAVDPGYGDPADRVSLADGYPLLLANTASLAEVNDWVAEESPQEWPLPMTRFRPHVVVEGAAAWAEDSWLGGRIRIGAVIFRAPKPCDRCVVTTTDQETGVRGHEPLRTLGRHRNRNQKLLFGLNLIPDGTGEIGVGDEVEFLSD
jgi:uncharacterized protein YcbX